MPETLPKIFAHDINKINHRHEILKLPDDHFEVHAVLRGGLNRLYRMINGKAGQQRIAAPRLVVHELLAPLESRQQRTGILFSEEHVRIRKIAPQDKGNIYEIDIPDCSQWPQAMLADVGQGTYAVTDRVGVKVYENETPYINAQAMSRLAGFVLNIAFVGDPSDNNFQRLIPDYPTPVHAVPAGYGFTRTLAPDPKYL